MKIYIAVFCLTFICLTASFNFSQSRRAAPETDKTQKANRRPSQTAAPTATPATPEDEPNTTNIERIETPPVDNIVTDGEVIKVDTELVSIPVKVSD